MNKFDKSKRYIFDVETAISSSERIKSNYENHKPTKLWMDICDGESVTIINEYEGEVDSGLIEPYVVLASFCKEIVG